MFSSRPCRLPQQCWNPFELGASLVQPSILGRRHLFNPTLPWSPAARSKCLATTFSGDFSCDNTTQTSHEPFCYRLIASLIYTNYALKGIVHIVPHQSVRSMLTPHYSAGRDLEGVRPLPGGSSPPSSCPRAAAQPRACPCNTQRDGSYSRLNSSCLHSTNHWSAINFSHMAIPYFRKWPFVHLYLS